MDSILRSQLMYISVILAIILIPKIIQRYKFPAPLTSFGLGILVSFASIEYIHDPVIGVLAILGISSLFLFAGLEVNVSSLKVSAKALISHLLIRSLILVLCIWIGVHFFNLTWQASGLIALAVLTPSTGFILDSLPTIGLTSQERFWVTSKAISGEILALSLLFFILKSESLNTFAFSTGILLLIIFGLPTLFILLNKYVIPYAPNSEFSLLILVGIIAAYITKQIGVYYLVGAFIAGIVASQLRERLPNLASENNLNAVKLFATFFVPFYFFYSGMKIPHSAFNFSALWLGLAISAVLIPLRIASVTIQLVIMQGDAWKSAFRVSTALTPTLIFTLVISTILHERFDLPDDLFGGLLLYACISTLIPIWVLPKPYKFDLT